MIEIEITSTTGDAAIKQWKAEQGFDVDTSNMIPMFNKWLSKYNVEYDCGYLQFTNVEDAIAFKLRFS